MVGGVLVERIPAEELPDDELPDENVPAEDEQDPAAGGIAVAVLRMSRPPSNRLDEALRSALVEACEQVAEDPAVRSVVLHGGPRVFSAGLDVEEMVHWGYREADRHAAVLQRTFSLVASLGKPTIAAITGDALSAGLDLALACDLRVAGDNAHLGYPETTLGIIPAGGGLGRLTAAVGPSTAKDLTYSGRQLGADEALHRGLVDRVVQPADVLSHAVGWARSLACGAPAAMAAAKRVIDAAALGEPTGERERLELVGLFATEDRYRGMHSYLDDGPRAARFVGH